MNCSSTTNDVGYADTHLSPHAQASYLQQVSLFARHFGKSPDALTPEHIRTYQIYLTNEKKLAAGSMCLSTFLDGDLRGPKPID